MERTTRSTRLARQAREHEDRQARAQARIAINTAAKAWEDGDINAAYQADERAGMILDHAGPIETRAW